MDTSTLYVTMLCLLGSRFLGFSLQATNRVVALELSLIARALATSKPTTAVIAQSLGNQSSTTVLYIAVKSCLSMGLRPSSQ